MNVGDEKTDSYSPFWPLCLLALSLAVCLGWQVTVSARQYSASLPLADQQALVVAQAAQAESKFQAFVMDLLTLSKTDADARAIVTKYGIKYNPPPSEKAMDVMGSK